MQEEGVKDMDSFLLYNPTKLYFGKNQLENLVPELNIFGKKVLLVYGGGSIKKNGIYDQVLEKLQSNAFEIYQLANIEPNPKVETIQKGIDLCKANTIDAVLAIGGGSCIDAAKLVCAGAKYEGDPWNIVMRQYIPKEALPLGVVLTIAATGSEMNGTSVISRWETNEKYSWASILVFPKFSILDPTYTFSVPKNQTIYGIVDMMSHIMEQYFHCAENTPILDRMCEGLLKTVMEVAPKVLEDLQDYQARETLMYAGTLALNRSLSTGAQGDWASHGIEHAVSAYYDIAHGGGLAIIFPNWMVHVYPEAVDRFAQLAVRVFDVDATGKTKDEVAYEGIQALRDFWSAIGAPSRLADYQIGSEKLDEMVAHVMKRPLGQIKKLTQEDIEEILRSCL